jgi:hypothetical protein
MIREGVYLQNTHGREDLIYYAPNGNQKSLTKIV